MIPLEVHSWSEIRIRIEFQPGYLGQFLRYRSIPQKSIPLGLLLKKAEKSFHYGNTVSQKKGQSKRGII